MSPYKWRRSNYLCPDCKRRLESKAGPDGLNAQRCPNCDWSKVFDPNADEFPARELERARLATDGGRSEGGVRHRVAWWLLGGKNRVERNLSEIHNLARDVDEGRDDPYTGMRIESETNAIDNTWV